MDDLELKETLERLEEQQRKIIEQLSNSSTNAPKRDFWEKLAAISPIISGVAIALSALLCTYQYNQQQIKLQEAQTVEKFIPHLMGNDTSKRMAILAMKTLVNTDLAAKYAAMFPSEGTLSALKTIAKNGTSQDKKIVSKTYDQITKDDSILKPNDLQTSANTTSVQEPSLQPEQTSTTATTDTDTAGDTAQAEKPHVPVPKEHSPIPGKEHSVAPPREHPADDKESRDESIQKREMEARQPQLERIRSSALKEENATSL